MYTKILAAFIRIFFLPSRVKRRHNSITFDSSDGGRVCMWMCSSVRQSLVECTMYPMCVWCACVWLMFASDHSDQCKCALYFRIEIESHVVYEQNNDSIPTPANPHPPTRPSSSSRNNNNRTHPLTGAIRLTNSKFMPLQARNWNVPYIPKTIWYNSHFPIPNINHSD